MLDENTIKIEKKIVKKRYYLDLLNEGSQRGGLGQGDGFELVCGSLRGVLVLLRTMSLTVLARAIDITSAGAPASIKKLSNRNKRKDPKSQTQKKNREGVIGSVSGLQDRALARINTIDALTFPFWERRTMAETGWGFLEETRNKMREK